MIWLQLVMVFPGLYTAVKLDEFRAWPLEAERRILTGHWHILATVSAVMMLLLIADRLNVRGWMRQVLGWGVLLGGNLAFTIAIFYEFLPPEANRDWTILYMDIGVGLFLIVLALFLGRRLVDLFSDKGALDGGDVKTATSDTNVTLVCRTRRCADGEAARILDAHQEPPNVAPAGDRVGRLPERPPGGYDTADDLVDAVQPVHCHQWHHGPEHGR